jgi:hypothetical protein
LPASRRTVRFVGLAIEGLAIAGIGMSEGFDPVDHPPIDYPARSRQVLRKKLFDRSQPLLA